MHATESPESSSPIITRAVAAGLRGEHASNYIFPGWQKMILTGLGALPQGVARLVISRFESITGLPPKVMDDFSIEDLVRARLADYSQLSGLFPNILLGAALGGATSYLSLALGGPFLPQAFVLSLKKGSSTGNAVEYLDRSLETALDFADHNPGLMTIQHYDPVHDGWMTRYVNHLRFKLLELPPAYASFIRSHLRPGGAVVYLDCGASWLRYRLGPRSVFQVGGWGGVSAEEFLTGSERVRTYARKSGLKVSNWSLKDYPLEYGPESEWGSEPGLDSSLEQFCLAEGFRFIRIRLPHPNDFSRLAFSLAGRLLEKEGRVPAGVLVEMFSQFDSHAVRQSGLLPLWLVFNTADSLEFLKNMMRQFPAGKPVFFSPLSTFSLTPDIAPFEDWEEALKGHNWINIGARRSHYPADARALVKWAKPLREWVASNHDPVKAVVKAEELEEMAKFTSGPPEEK